MQINFTDTLRKYYKNYGIHNEGPPDGINLNDIIPINKEVLSDLHILNNLLSNDKSKKDFKICNDLMEDIASKLSDEALFMKELEIIKDQINFDVENISNGITWFNQAQATDPFCNNNIEIPSVNGVNSSFIKISKMQGSLILRSYIALAYMYSGNGNVYKIIREGSKNNKCKIMQTCRSFFDSDYIRHVRNSLAHGTFKMNIAGIHFKDNFKGGVYEIVATQGFLDKIMIWIFVLYYQCLLFLRK